MKVTGKIVTPSVNQKLAQSLGYIDPFVTIRERRTAWISRGRYNKHLLVAIKSDHSEQPEFRKGEFRNRRYYPYYWMVMTNSGETLIDGVEGSMEVAMLDAAKSAENVIASSNPSGRWSNKPLESYPNRKVAGRMAARILSTTTTLEGLEFLAVDTLSPGHFGLLYYTLVHGMTQVDAARATGYSPLSVSASVSIARRKVGEVLESALILELIYDSFEKSKHVASLEAPNDQQVTKLVRGGYKNYPSLLSINGEELSRKTGLSSDQARKIIREAKKKEGLR